MSYTTVTGIYLLRVMNAPTFGDKVIFHFLFPVGRYLHTDMKYRPNSAAMRA